MQDSTITHSIYIYIYIRICISYINISFTSEKPSLQHSREAFQNSRQWLSPLRWLGDLTKKHPEWSRVKRLDTPRIDTKHGHLFQGPSFWVPPAVSFPGGVSFLYLVSCHLSRLLGSQTQGTSNHIDPKWFPCTYITTKKIPPSQEIHHVEILEVCFFFWGGASWKSKIQKKSYP